MCDFVWKTISSSSKLLPHGRPAACGFASVANTQILYARRTSSILRALLPRSHCVLSFILNPLSFVFAAVLVFLFAAGLIQPVNAGTLTLDLGKSEGVASVGAVQRWDRQGNPRRPVDPKAKIDAPAVDATAKSDGQGRWLFAELPPGKYDLVILARDRLRIEGWQFALLKEFDPFFPPTETTDDETRDFITDDIAKSPHYENKLAPLAMGGDKKAVRVLLMLIRDKPTSYESDSPGAATMRHEIWQYSWNYGAWQKERRTHVLDRLLLPRDELRKWTWLWDPKLGGIEVTSQDATIKYELPSQDRLKKLPGLHPY